MLIFLLVSILFCFFLFLLFMQKGCFAIFFIINFLTRSHTLSVIYYHLEGIQCGGVNGVNGVHQLAETLTFMV